jgi:hypothetical protein
VGIGEAIMLDTESVVELHEVFDDCVTSTQHPFAWFCVLFHHHNYDLTDLLVADLTLKSNGPVGHDVVLVCKRCGYEWRLLKEVINDSASRGIRY